MLAHDYTLVEVYNPHSNSRKDTATWHELIRRLPEICLGRAVVMPDENLFNRGWVMVKTEGVSEEALRKPFYEVVSMHLLVLRSFWGLR